MTKLEHMQMRAAHMRQAKAKQKEYRAERATLRNRLATAPTIATCPFDSQRVYRVDSATDMVFDFSRRDMINTGMTEPEFRAAIENGTFRAVIC